MTLEVDASDVARGLYRVTQTIPVAPGTRRLTLLYPQWLPGNHAPRGPIAELVGSGFLRRRASAVAGSAIRSKSHAFHLDLPPAASGPVGALRPHIAAADRAKGA